MSLSLGEKLRQAREERGISISEVAEQTRISPQYIKSIENDDYKPLPGGIFNKGFVRSYARYVGFDESQALEEYAQLMAVNAIETEPDQTFHHAEVWTDDRSARSMIPTVIFAAFILALLTGGIILLVRYLSQPAGTTVPMANTAVSNNVSAANASPENAANTNPAATQSNFVVEVKANNESVWVGYTLDGSKSVKTLAPGESLRLDVQNSLRLGYARVRATNLEITLNGKRLNVLNGGPKGNFDLVIDKNNVAQIMQTGEIGTPLAAAPAPAPTPVSTPTAAATPRPSPKPTPAVTPRPAFPPANTNINRRPPQ